MRIFAVFEDGQEDALDYFQFEESAIALVDHLTQVRPGKERAIEIIDAKAGFDPAEEGE